VDVKRFSNIKYEDFIEFKSNQKLLNINRRLLVRGNTSAIFYTRDSKLYPNQDNKDFLGKINNRSYFDGLSSRIVGEYRAYCPSRSDYLFRKLEKRYREISEDLIIHSKELAISFSPTRAWKYSIVASILFGMVSMTLIYRYLGQQASAGSLIVNGSPEEMLAYQNEILSAPFDFNDSTTGKVLGEEQINMENINLSEENVAYIEKIITDVENRSYDEFENEIREMVKGYPIELMIPNIMEKDQIVAAFLVGIAKKESNWGKRVPLYQGQDCFNYWGYRGPNRTGTGGHSCFATRKEAIDTVAKRLEWLVENQNRNTPEKMIIWKCGSSCASHGREDVLKWISDVNIYFHQLND
jgi:hypothetical protein